MSPETLHWLPTFNASLNATSALFLVAAWILVKKDRSRAHGVCMGVAVLLSIVFFVSYAIYHYHVGATPFEGRGYWRLLYFSILISHTILAVSVPFLVIVMLVRAWRRRWAAHRRLGRWALPIWLYVAVTGVLVYLMLYHLFPGGGG